MHEQSRLSFAPLAALCLFATLSCVDDPPGPSDDVIPTPPGTGGSSGTDDPEPGGGSGCPFGEPRIGESCPPMFGDGSRCSYSRGTCTGGGSTYETFQDYCCFSGLWNQCPSETPPPPCDEVDAAPPPVEPDAGEDDAPAGDVDAGAIDAPEVDAAAPDADVDAEPDAGAPDTEDAPGADVEPDLAVSEDLAADTAED